MRCPYCQTPIGENSPACPRCALNVETAGTAFGSPPNLRRGVNDTALALSEAQRSKLQSVFSNFHSSFPQIHLSLATISIPADTGLAAYSFWLFNRSGLCPASERGSANHDILLTLDTQNHRAHLIFGYGLEPFVGETLAQAALAEASEAFKSSSWATGIQLVTSALEKQLVALTSELDRTYGISVSDFYEAEKHRLKEIEGTAETSGTW